MTEEMKSLFEKLREEIQNLTGKNTRRIVIDFYDEKISAVIQQKIGKTFCNRLIEFEEEPKNENQKSLA